MIYQEIQMEGGGWHPVVQEYEEVKCKDGTYGNCTEYTVGSSTSKEASWRVQRS